MDIPELVRIFQGAVVENIVSTVFGGSVLALSLSGFMPRFGPGRAIALRLSSILSPTPRPLSSRKSEIETFRKLLLEPPNYTVVVGPKGVGKSALVMTALRWKQGVVYVQVPPGMAETAIIDTSLRRIANFNIPLLDPKPSARRVLWWYNPLQLSWLGRPTIVLAASERNAGTPAAEINSSAKLLAGLGFRVVIDASENAQDMFARNTLREVEFHLEAMPLEVARISFPKLFEILDGLRLSDVVFEVIGGRPALLLTLERRIHQSSDPKAILEAMLVDLVSDACGLVHSHSLVHPSTPHYTTLQNEGFLFLDSSALSSRREADKVLRLFKTSTAPVWVPASPTVLFVLRHDLANTLVLKERTLEQIVTLCRISPQPFPNLGSPKY